MSRLISWLLKNQRPTFDQIMAGMTPVAASPPPPAFDAKDFPFSLPCTVGILSNDELTFEGFDLPVIYLFGSDQWVEASLEHPRPLPFRPTHWAVQKSDQAGAAAA